VLVELGASRPEVGGSVRWPLYANGRLVGTTFGWTVVLGLFTDTEVLAVTQYLSHYWPWLYHGTSLSPGGIGVAAALEAVLVVLNWFGIQLFVRVNLVVTWVKFIVPAITVIALFASGFHGSNLTSAGGFAPYGGSAILSVIASGGLIYALNGFQPPVDLSGEARNPRRDIPRAILVAIAAAAVLYILLRLAFLVAIPHSLLGHGWNGISFSSPFGQLALLVNLGWLSSLLYVDAVISPSRSEFVGTAEGARQTYALSKNGLLPKYFLSVPGASGVPRRPGCRAGSPASSGSPRAASSCPPRSPTGPAGATCGSPSPLPSSARCGPSSSARSTRETGRLSTRSRREPGSSPTFWSSSCSPGSAATAVWAGSGSRGTRSASRWCRSASTCGRSGLAASTSRRPPGKMSRTPPPSPTR
jgi:hypothetical protein